MKCVDPNPYYQKLLYLGILLTERLVVKGIIKEKVCDADTESLSSSDIWPHCTSFANQLPILL